MNTANQKFDIYLPPDIIHGWLEVEIGSNWGYTNATGRLTKRFSVAADTNVINSQNAFYVNADIPIANHIAISDLKYDSTKGFHITVAMLTPHEIAMFVVVRSFGGRPVDLPKITLSDIYTTDTTVYPEPIVTTDFRPVTDNNVSLGSASLRFSQLYAGTATINTSDERDKKNINDISEQYISFFNALRPVSFEFNDGIRSHLGLISQEVEQAMYATGLNSLDFAGFINSPVTQEIETGECEEIETQEEYEYPDESGGKQIGVRTVTRRVPIMKTVIIGERYGLRYGEFTPLLIAVVQKYGKQLYEQGEIIQEMQLTINSLYDRLHETI